MRKIIIIYLVCIIALFFLPALLVKEYYISDKLEKEENCISEIKLLLSETSEIVTMSLDDYIMGVLVGEMPVDFDIEALKAQAVVARTYTLYKIKNASRFT